jgi:hypothetical protein
MNWQPAFVGGGTTVASASVPQCSPSVDVAHPVVTTLQPGGYIAGSFYDAFGQPARHNRGANIGMATGWPIPDLWTNSGFIDVVDDGNGRYLLAGLPAGDYEFTSPFSPDHPRVHVEVGATTTLDWRLENNAWTGSPPASS